MPDARFFPTPPSLPLAAVAERVGARLQDPNRGDELIHTLAPLDRPTGGALGFCENPQRFTALSQWPKTTAILTLEAAGEVKTEAALLFTPTPALAFARIARHLFPDPMPPAGIAASAIVDGSAVVDPSASVGDQVIIGAGAKIGPRVLIRAGAILGDGVVIGADSDIGNHASIRYALLGQRVRISAGVRIGETGFGFLSTPETRVKIPHLGRVILGDDVDIGANSCIDRGSLTDTVIGQGTMIDNLVHIAHNVHIGKGCILLAQVGIAGSCVLEDYVVLGGQVGLADHIHIGKGTKLASRAGLFRDVPAGMTLGGFPAAPIREWHRQSAFLLKIGQKKDRVNE